MKGLAYPETRHSSTAAPGRMQAIRSIGLKVGVRRNHTSLFVCFHVAVRCVQEESRKAEPVAVLQRVVPNALLAHPTRMFRRVGRHDGFQLTPDLDARAELLSLVLGQEVDARESGGAGRW